MTLTQELLKEYLHYEPQTGLFTWVRVGSNRVKVGHTAGSLSSPKGYFYIRIKSKLYGLHRLAWLYTYGYLPEQIDHLNHDKTDNRIANLANVSHKENTKNMPKYKNNASGVTGVSWDAKGSKWCVRISANSKRESLGFYSDFTEAVNVRRQAELTYGFHANHGKDLRGLHL